MERNLIKAEQEFNNQKEQHDSVQNMLMNLQAGIEHLCGKLNEIRISSPDTQIKNFETVTQVNLVESIELARKKIKVLLKEIKEDTSLYEEAIEAVKSGEGMQRCQNPGANMYRSSFNIERSKIDPNGHLPSSNIRVKLPQ
jgi:chromosome segregation ATPase